MSFLIWVNQQDCECQNCHMHEYVDMFFCRIKTLCKSQKMQWSWWITTGSQNTSSKCDMPVILKNTYKKAHKWPFPSIRKFPSRVLWLYSKSWLTIHWLLSNGYVDTPQGSQSLHSGSWCKWQSSYVLQFQMKVWCLEELFVSHLTKVKRLSSMHQLFDCHKVPVR